MKILNIIVLAFEEKKNHPVISSRKTQKGKTTFLLRIKKPTQPFYLEYTQSTKHLKEEKKTTTLKSQINRSFFYKPMCSPRQSCLSKPSILLLSMRALCHQRMHKVIKTPIHQHFLHSETEPNKPHRHGDVEHSLPQKARDSSTGCELCRLLRGHDYTASPHMREQRLKVLQAG